MLHPMVVHFPIALLITAGGLYIFAWFRPDHPVSKSAFWIHIFGLVGGVLAILTGGQAESSITHTREIHEMIEQHELLGWITVWLMAIMAGWHLLRNRSWKKIEHLLHTIGFVLILFVLGYSSWIGGKMVYKQGAGVEPMEVQLKIQFDEEMKRDTDLTD